MVSATKLKKKLKYRLFDPQKEIFRSKLLNLQILIHKTI